jgi:Rad3-related DNA helicase
LHQIELEVDRQEYVFVSGLRIYSLCTENKIQQVLIYHSCSNTKPEKSLWEGTKIISLDLNSVLAKYAAVDQRKYQEACICDIVNALNDEVDILIDLPTGAGKTVVYSPIVADASERGYRTLVLTATKQGQRRVGYEIDKFSKKEKRILIFGIQEYICPILKSKAETWFCAEQKEQCKKTKINCEVIQSDKDYNERNLVVTNFAKFLLARSTKPYNMIVLDDSHSFENSKEQAYQITIQAASAVNFYENRKDVPKLQEFFEDFLNIYSDIFSRCINPGETDGAVSQEYVSNLATLATKYNMDLIKQEIATMRPSKDRDLCWNVYHYVLRCTKASQYQFFVRSDYYEQDDFDSSELISRKEDIDAFIKKRFEKSRVIFATATPGDVIKHASTCSLREYQEDDLRVTPSRDVIYPEIENWFQQLSILVVNNIGDTRQSTPFDEAIDLTTKILTTRPERALVLFKNYRDQRKANDRLANIFTKDKLFFIDSTIQDSDFVEDLANKSQISLASASSTLWEGINIQDLRIAVVVTPPFIRPPVGKKQTYPDERRMLVRLQQGIGRIIRRPTDSGVAVLMDSRFEKYVKRKSFDKRLFEITEFVNSDQVIPAIEKILGKGE